MNTPVKPQPSRLLIVISITVIALGLVGATFYLPYILFLSDISPHVTLPSSIFVIFCAGICLLQYLATFRRDLKSSWGLFVLLLIMLQFSYCILGSTLYHEFGHLTDMVGTLLFLLGIITATSFAGWQMWRWHHQLKQHSKEISAKPEKLRFSLKEAFYFVFISLVVGFSAYYLALTDHDTDHRNYQQLGILASREQAPIPLPQNASSISYYEREYGKYLLIEFNTDEESFIGWVEEETQPWPPHLKESLIKEIDNYTWMDSCFFHQDTFEKPEYISVGDGLEYNRLLRKVRLHAIYDRETGRAYCTRTQY